MVHLLYQLLPRFLCGAAFLTSYFFVAFGTVPRIIRRKSLGTVVAFATELAAVYIRHFHLGRTLFHFEDLRVAIQALKALIGMHFAVEGDLAHGRIPLRSFSRRDRIRRSGNRACNKYRNNNYQSVHNLSPLSSSSEAAAGIISIHPKKFSYSMLPRRSRP